jgi:NADH dehydrogenase FAD-containing subunit
LIEYAKKLAVEIGVDPSLVSVTLIEAADKVLMMLPKEFTDPIDAHLRAQGVSLMLSTAVMRQDVEEIFLKDAQMMASTVVWTSGVRANALYEASGLPVDKRGKVEVDERMRAKGEDVIYVVGDGAQTKYSGWAQTAFYDGLFVAKTIASEWGACALPTYAPKPPVNAIPAGDGWAAVLLTAFGKDFRIYGRIGWWLRRLADLKSFMMILPLGKAFKVFLGMSISEKCPICGAKTHHDHDAFNTTAPR